MGGGPSLIKVSYIALGLTVNLSLIWLLDLSLFRRGIFLMCPNILPLLVTWTMSIISSIGSNACLFSRRCWAYFDLLFPYLKSLKCSWNLILKCLPVCPVYFMLQSGQVSWYMPLLPYLFWSVPCFVARRL